MVLKANDCEGSSVKEKETDNNIFKKIDEMKAYARIVAQIKDLIEDGSLVHGSRLPSETELARSFGKRFWCWNKWALSKFQRENQRKLCFPPQRAF